MQLKFQQVLPEPLKKNDSSEVWNKNWSLAPRGKLFLKAASGKGKSSFIHILYGLRKDYAGSVSWENQDIKENTDEQWAGLRQNKLSIVFQDLRLFDELSVLENIEIKQLLTPGASIEKIREHLDFLGLGNKSNQKAGTLSYGEKQRVAIIRALVQPFSWLLLDEPFSHLDDENIEKAVQLIARETNERKAGLIMVDLEDDNWFNFTRKMTL